MQLSKKYSKAQDKETARNELKKLMREHGQPLLLLADLKTFVNEHVRQEDNLLADQMCGEEIAN